MQFLFASNTKKGPAALSGTVLALALLAAAMPARAQQGAEVPFNQRYPGESIQSTAQADAYLQAAAKERAMLSDRYINDQRDCYRKFFVASCLEDAKERNRTSVKQVREVEVAADVYKRQFKADERDKALAEQRAKDEKDAVRREHDQKVRSANAARKSKDGAAKQRSAEAAEAQAQGHEDDRVKAHNAKLRSERAAEAANASQRAAIERAYQEKQKAAAAHRLDVEQKKAAKQKERAAKRAQQQEQQ